MNAEEALKEARAAHSRDNDVEALRLFRIAADQGDPDAQYTVGCRYGDGRGTPQDYAEAVKWFRRSAEQGDIKSLYSLGWYYYWGEGVPQDDVLAYMWLSLAAPTGYERAIEVLARVAKRMTPSQISEAEKLARDFGIHPIIPPCDWAAG